MTFVFINPPRQYAKARNVKRWTAINEILNAIYDFRVDNNGDIPKETSMAECPATSNIGTGGLDLASDLVPEYLASMPLDPKGGTEIDTGYSICKSAVGRITVAAPNAENDEEITVTK